MCLCRSAEHPSASLGPTEYHKLCLLNLTIVSIIGEAKEKGSETLWLEHVIEGATTNVDLPMNSKVLAASVVRQARWNAAVPLEVVRGTHYFEREILPTPEKKGQD